MDKATSAHLIFGGDFAPVGRYEALIAAKGGDIFSTARPILESADFVMFNLETPLCSKVAEIQKTGPCLRANPETLCALQDLGVHAVSLANNHIFDFGRSGLEQTIHALETRKIQHVGAGLERSSAEAALRIPIKGLRISFFSFAEREFNVSNDGRAGAALLDPIRMAPLIMQERTHADAIIVCLHGGNEYFPYPRPGLRRICHFLIDVGADAVIGHHPHVPGPYEIYKGKPIFYSLGNLIFDSQTPRLEWDEGYFASLDFRFDGTGLAAIKVEVLPFFQAVNRGGLELMNDQERTAFITRIEERRGHLEKEPDVWMAAWNEFVFEKQSQALIDLSLPIRFPGLRRIIDLSLFRNLIMKPANQRRRLNMLRCASHRELIEKALNDSLTSLQKN